MYFSDLGMAEELMNSRVAKAQGQAELRSLLRQARPEQGRGLSWQGRRLLSQVGHLLVASGEWLERNGLPQPSL